MHFASDDQAVEMLFDNPDRMSDRGIRHARAGIAGEADEVEAELIRPLQRFNGDTAPNRKLNAGLDHFSLVIHWLQIHTDRPSASTLDPRDGILFEPLRHAGNLRVEKVERVEHEQVRTGMCLVLGIGRTQQ